MPRSEDWVTKCSSSAIVRMEAWMIPARREFQRHGGAPTLECLAQSLYRAATARERLRLCCTVGRAILSPAGAAPAAVHSSGSLPASRQDNNLAGSELEYSA